MDTKSFVKILRKVIREEVGKAVKQALTEKTFSDKQVIEHGMNLSDAVDSPDIYSPITRNKPKKKFAKNSMINDLLNETNATADFAEMMDGGQYNQMGSTRTSDMVGMDGERVTPKTPELQAVQNALTKDYSQIIKAIDKKNNKMGTRR